jgi:hypothetical protein
MCGIWLHGWQVSSTRQAFLSLWLLGLFLLGLVFFFSLSTPFWGVILKYFWELGNPVCEEILPWYKVEIRKKGNASNKQWDHLHLYQWALAVFTVPINNQESQSKEFATACFLLISYGASCSLYKNGVFPISHPTHIILARTSLMAKPIVSVVVLAPLNWERSLQE